MACVSGLEAEHWKSGKQGDKKVGLGGILGIAAERIEAERAGWGRWSFLSGGTAVALIPPCSAPATQGLSWTLEGGHANLGSSSRSFSSFIDLNKQFWIFKKCWELLELEQIAETSSLSRESFLEVDLIPVIHSSRLL